MKGFRAFACALLISLPVLGYSGTLVVSQDLALEYPEPELISHSSNMLILKTLRTTELAAPACGRAG